MSTEGSGKVRNGVQVRESEAESRKNNNNLILVGVGFVVAIVLAAIAIAIIALRSQTPRICLTATCVQTAASLLGGMNLSSDPCDDFFEYACGTWNDVHSIPEDRSSISTFEVLADELQFKLKRLLEQEKEADQAAQKAKQFYQSCMDVEEIARTGDEPVKMVLRALGGWPVMEKEWRAESSPGLAHILGVLKRNFTMGVLIEEWVGPDDRNSSRNIIQLDQMQLGLPSRDYFLHPESSRDLEAYHNYMTDVAVLMGAANRSDAKKQLWEVVQLEMLLANITVPEEERIDTEAIYVQLSLSELQSHVKNFDFHTYLDILLADIATFDRSERIVIYSLPYLERLSTLLPTIEPRVLHNYVLWRFVMELMPHMPPKYEETRAEFRRVLLGVLSDRVRWHRCVDWTNKKLGMAVGALFVRKHFNHESKSIALEMIHQIREAFNDLLEDNEWMDEPTRQVARDKANSMSERIGYPEYITNRTVLEEEYQNVTIASSGFLVNLLNILKFEGRRNAARLRDPVDKDRWSTEPAVVNAFYNPNKNDIVFPAGILQPLFYSADFPKSLNYGGIGVVIGHEITHGFDDKGRQFDKLGNLQQWWDNETIDAFREAAACIVEQYSAYVMEEIQMPINGIMTQGENIADNGGLKQAFRAYKKWVAKHGEEALLPGLDLSHDQLFFLNYAQIWCGSMRPEDALTKIRSSVHSPGRIRVLGPLSNSFDFAKAYQCPLGSKMNPAKKCSVW